MEIGYRREVVEVEAGVRGRGDLSLWMTRVQLAVVVVSAALLAGAGSTGAPEAAALALLVACALAAVVAAPAVSEAPAVVAHRAWGIRSARIRRAEAPDRVRERYRGKRDHESVRALRTETARVHAEAGASPLGCLPLLLQAPVLLALFRVLAAAARESAVGALGPALVAQLDSATIAGASLTSGVMTGGAASAVAVVLTLVLALALWLAQHRQLTLNTPPEALEGPVGSTQRLMVWVVPATACLSAFTFPVGVLLYFACANTVSLLQQLVVIRWLPTPGSPAAAR